MNKHLSLDITNGNRNPRGRGRRTFPVPRKSRDRHTIPIRNSKPQKGIQAYDDYFAAHLEIFAKTRDTAIQ